MNSRFKMVLPHYFIPILAFFFLAAGFIPVKSQPITITVTTTAGDTSAGSLGDAINQINASSEGGVIDLSGISSSSITLLAALPVLNRNVTILGNNATINGQDLYSVFNLNSGSVSIDSLTISHAMAHGGNGGMGDSTSGAGGGGGAGLGGALFVNTGVTLIINKVSVEDSRAIGGSGGAFGTSNLVGGGGGGGNGGNGGNDGAGGVGILGTGGNGGNAFGQGETGGTGGFGSGGGGGNGLIGSVPPHGGDGGFGGGGGGGGIGTFVGFGGHGGEYGGDGSNGFNGGGGGGAGLGGGIFVNSGGTLIVAGSSFSGNSALGGAGADLGGNGKGLGGDLFLYNSGVTFTGPDSTLVVDSIDGTGNLVFVGSGTLLLAGINGYTGGTRVTSGGVLNVVADRNLGDPSGAVTLDNGILRTSGNILFDSDRDLELGSGNGTLNTLGFNSSWNGEVNGSGGLAVIGGGALTLTNSANDYSGGTSIGGGAMLVVGNDSNLGDTAGAVTLDNGGLGTSTDVKFDLNRNLILGSGGGAFNTNGHISSWNGLITGSGGMFVVGAGALTLSNSSNSFSGGVFIGGGTTVNVGSDGNLGAATGSVTLNNGTLQTSSGASFNSGRGMVLLAGNGTFDTLGDISSWGGVISGIGGLSLVDSSSSGSGALTLANNNTFTGLVDVSGTRLVLGVSNALSGTNAVNLVSNGILDLDNHYEAIGSLSGSGGVSLGSGLLTVGSNNLSTGFSGVISGSGPLLKTGSGSLTLTGANNYSGGTSIGGGILNVAGDGNLGAASGAVALDGGSLQTSAGVSFDTNRNLSLGFGNGTFDTLGHRSSWNGLIGGSGGLAVIGGGILSLTNAANTYSGGTSISGDTSLHVGGDGNLGATSGAVTLDNGSLRALAGVDFNLNRRLILGLGNGTFDTNGQISAWNGFVGGSGGLNVLGGGALALTNAFNAYSGGTSVGGATLIVGSDGNLGVASGSLTLDNGTLRTSSGVNFDSNRNLQLGLGNGTFDTSGQFSSWNGRIDGAGGLNVANNGTLTLTNTNNTYSGGTSISSNAMVNISADSNLGAVSGAVTMNNYGWLSTSAGVSFDPNRSLVLSGPGVIDVNGFNPNWQGQISGSGILYVLSGGPIMGTLTLSGANTHSGGTYAYYSMVNVSTDGNLGDMGATLSLENGALKTSAGITFNANRNMELVAPIGGIDVNGFDSTWQGQIGGAGTLWVWSGSGTPGTLRLTGDNSYTGGTYIAPQAVVDVGSDGNLGNTAGFVELNNGTLRTSAGVSFAPARVLWLDPIGGTFDTNAQSSTWNGTVGGAGTLNVTGAGSLSLAALSNTYSGGTSIGGDATVNVGGDGSLGAATGAVTLDNGTLQTLSGINFNPNRNLVLRSGGGVFDTMGNVSTWDGVVSGNGGFSLTDSTASGSGGLFLTQSTTLGGLVDITGATLVLNNFPNAFGSLSGSGGVSLDGGSLEVGTDNSSTLFSGVISGNGPFLKTGSGALTLTGINAYSGGTSIVGGSLIVGDPASTGAVIQGPVAVDPNGLLGGYGWVIGDVTNNGTVKPAGSSGMLAVSQLNQGPDGLVQIDVLPGNYQSGWLAVGGANLDGSVTVVLDGGNYGIRYRYIILSSATSILTTFDSVSAGATFMTPSLSYGWDAVTLTLFRNNIDFAGLYAQTPNQEAVAGILNESIPTASDDFIDILNGLYVLPGDEGRTALDQMSGSFYSPLAGIMLNNHLFATRRLFEHADGSGFAMPSAIQSVISRSVASEINRDAPAASQGLQAAAKSPRLWVESLISTGNVDGNDNVIGYETKKIGFVAAYDTPLSEDFKAGLSAAYNRLFLDSSDSGSCATRADNTLLGIYGGPSFGDWDITAAVQYGWDKYQTNRTVSIGPVSSLAQANFDGNEISASLQISTKLLNDPAFNLKSQFGAQYTHLLMNGFTETGAGALNLTMAGQTYDSMRPFAGLDGAGNMNLGGNTILTPMVGLSLYRELMDLNPQVQVGLAGAPGMGYTVSGMTPTAFILGIGAGAQLVTGRGFNLYAGFNGHFGGNQTSNSFQGGANFNF